ncbi:MAG: ribosome small subunit-dependent GTPase A [Bacteroidales bacterium]|nr:ribosome small subunit-dependent GTPase A [Bacteroidales bacterium]
MEGLVEKSTGSWIYVRSHDGKRYPCKVKGRFRIQGIRTTNPVAIGDHVEFTLLPGEEEGMIHRILPRDNYIIRKATKLSREAHIIAANLDHAYLIVTLANPRTSTGFIDRFLVTATGYFIPSSLIFNKLDIYGPQELRQMEKLFDIYRQAGYPCYAVSALRGDHVEKISELLKGKVNLFAGHSGSGKSELIKAIDPRLNPRTGKISETHRKGMHTTTFAEMYRIPGDGYIIDTPGIKEFGLVHFELSEIPRCFPEMDRLLPLCQYSNCTHVHEPGCAVKKGVEAGEISEIRYNSYLSILNDRNKRS